MHRIIRAGGTLISLRNRGSIPLGEMHDLLLAVLGWAANFESRRRSERIKAGLTEREVSGLPIGRMRGAKDRKPRKVSATTSDTAAEQARWVAPGKCLSPRSP